MPGRVTGAVCKSQLEARHHTDSHGELSTHASLCCAYLHQSVAADRLQGKYSLVRAVWETGVLKRQTETQLNY